MPALPRTVSEVMSSPTFFVGEQTFLDEIDRILQDRGVSAVAVTDDGCHLAGVVSRTDLVRQALAIHSHQGVRTLVLPELTAEQAMTADPVHVPVAAPIAEAAQRMVERGIHRVFVTDHGALAGVVATREIMLSVERERLDSPLCDAMTADVLTVPLDAPMGSALERIADSHKHGLVVVKGDVPVGIVTTDEVLVAQHWPPTTGVEEWMAPRALCLPADMPLHRAAAHALAWDVRHIVVMDRNGMIGLVTGIDFTRAYAAAHQRS